MIDKPNYFAILPASVRYAKIPAIAKILFAEITALSNKNGFCNASNSYFSELYETTKRTISKNFQILENKGFIKLEIERNEAGTFRKIWPVLTPKQDLKKLQTRGAIFSPPRKKTSPPQEESFTPPRNKTSIQKNNTSINNTSNNNKETHKESAQTKNVDSFKKQTALDVTLKKYDSLSKFKPGFKAAILKYWRYLEEKKGSNWGSISTVKAQVSKFEKLIKEFTQKEILQSIEECIEKGNINFNPQWTKNKINKHNKTQQNEKTANNSKGLYEEYAAYLSTGASATEDYFNNSKWEDM